MEEGTTWLEKRLADRITEQDARIAELEAAYEAGRTKTLKEAIQALEHCGENYVGDEFHDGITHAIQTLQELSTPSGA